MENATHINTKTLAMGVLYLLTKRGTLDFPGSNRSAPAQKVVVGVGTRGLYRPSDASHFPFWVYWGIWHEAIVPVLENKDVQVVVTSNPSLRVHQNLMVLCTQDYDTLLGKIETYLIDSLVSTGYLPGETSTTLETGDSCSVEPVLINYNVPTGPDAQDLYHPDGTPKKTYTVVDT